jgi:hypothetical protein
MFIGSRRTLLRPQPVAAVGGTWTTAWDAVALGYLAGDGADIGNNGYTFVTRIPRSVLTAVGGSQARISIRGAGSGTEGISLSSLWMGEGGGAEGFDFGSAPVQLLQGGGSTITAAADTLVTLDPVAFVKDSTNPLVFAFHMNDSANDNIWKPGGTDPTGSGGYGSWFKNASDASTQNKTGYSDNSVSSWMLLINKVEFLL